MKKGFTLIELLAVIVILAIVALIATPMILGVIENAKKGAAKASVEGLIDSSEKYFMTEQLKGNSVSGTYTCIKTGCTNTVDSSKKVTVKGSSPIGTITIQDDGNVASASLIVDSKYEYVVTASKITSETSL